MQLVQPVTSVLLFLEHVLQPVLARAFSNAINFDECTVTMPSCL